MGKDFGKVKKKKRKKRKERKKDKKKERKERKERKEKVKDQQRPSTREEEGGTEIRENS